VRIDVSGLQFRYGAAPVLRGVSLSLPPGRLTCLVGPNGSGKSTLVKCMTGILAPRAGRVALDGRPIGEIAPRELARRLSFVSQDTPLSFPLTVFEVVLLGRKPYLRWTVREEDRRIVSEVLRTMGIEDLAQRYYGETSGGERQKVLVARALAQQPETLLLDEPTNNLDLRHQLEILHLLEDLVRRERISVLAVLHDLNLALRFAETVWMMRDGTIAASGRPDEVLTPERIREVFGVSVGIGRLGERSFIVPLEPANSEHGA